MFGNTMSVQAMRSWAKNNLSNESSLTYQQLCEQPAMHDHIQEQMSKFGKANGLNSLECPKGLYLSSEAFSVENDLLTPTMKSKRPQLRKKFAEQVNKMYEKQQTK